ncbi:hypothetical protein QR680_012764 [Steinernema hermaphroditum]|uniref:Uncharacterized protein n=1 Tax=Steinernema hermaphroditum TaxID=289476 RepID=A0AA39M1B5_9BILA|nr:hypothetical protein QR680_012764 [Steinernema hermaphroditum]
MKVAIKLYPKKAIAQSTAGSTPQALRRLRKSSAKITFVHLRTFSTLIQPPKNRFLIHGHYFEIAYVGGQANERVN